MERSGRTAAIRLPSFGFCLPQTPVTGSMKLRRCSGPWETSPVTEKTACAGRVDTGRRAPRRRSADAGWAVCRQLRQTGDQYCRSSGAARMYGICRDIDALIAAIDAGSSAGDVGVLVDRGVPIPGIVELDERGAPRAAALVVIDVGLLESSVSVPRASSRVVEFLGGVFGAAVVPGERFGDEQLRAVDAPADGDVFRFVAIGGLGRRVGFGDVISGGCRWTGDLVSSGCEDRRRWAEIVI